MNTARVAYHASNSEASAWSADLTDEKQARSTPEDLRAGWRASLEALGIPVEE